MGAALPLSLSGLELRRWRDHKITLKTPQGAFYAFPNVSAWGLPSQQLNDMLLNDAGVAALPGTDFGSVCEGHIRISYVADMKTLEEGMSRMRKFFEDLENGKYADVMATPDVYIAMGLSSISADS